MNFIADGRNIMQALPECLELSCSLHNFTLGNQTKHIMKKNADKGKSEGGNNMPKQRKTSSKNGEIETYLSSRYEFRYNTVLGRTERKEQPDTGYQLVPPSRSSISRDNDTPRAQNPIGAVADTIVSAADEVVEGLGDLITPSTQGNDYAETAWQRKLRNQPTERRSEDVDYSPITNRIIKVQKEEYLIKNACYSQAKYYLCKQNNKRSLLGRKQRSQVVRSFPNRYLFSFTNKVTSLFSISCILRIILPCIFLGLG